MAISLQRLKERADCLRRIRAFFDSRGFVEVSTPLRIPAPAMELHILAPPAGADHWLRTSPELHMKRLLAAGAERIYQLGPCFREGERGRRHRPEFTMLEWYRANDGLEAILRDAEELVRGLLGLDAPALRLSIEEAYWRYAGWNPLKQWDADRFDLDMVEKVEPSLPKDRLVFLTRYPAQAAALARLCPDDPRCAERAELYFGGVELANGYGELTDATLQRERFLKTAQERERWGQPRYPIDEAFLGDLPSMPPSGGIALGVDRLAMLYCGASEIGEVLPFSEES